MEEGVPEGFTIVYDEKRNSDEDILHIADLSNLQEVVKFEDLKPNYIATNKPDVWLNASTEDTTSNATISTLTEATTSNTSGRMKPGNLKLHIPSHAQQVKTMDPLEPTILSALDTNEQGSFDLLSYLCDVRENLYSKFINPPC